MTVVAFPCRGNRRTAKQLLVMILEHGHVEHRCPKTGRILLSLELEDWQLELLNIVGAEDDDLEDEGDAEEDRDEL